MNREELGQLIGQMGFSQNQSSRIMEKLIERLTSKGISIDQARRMIAADIQSEGKLYRQLRAMQKKDVKSSVPNSADPETCPKCGRPQTRGAAGQPAGECASCGVIFKKAKQIRENPEPSPAPVASIPQAQHSAIRGFISRHKLITAMVALVIGLLLVGLSAQAFYRYEHRKLLKTFDQQLKMDEKEGFEASLENMRFLIESTAVLVAMRGWTEKDISRFCGGVDERIRRFVEMMETAASGQGTIFGYELSDVKENLCAGMRMVILSIRNKDARSIRLAFDMAFQAPRACDVSRYKPSSKMVLVRDGKEYVLKRRTESNSSAENNTTGMHKHGGQTGKQNDLIGRLVQKKISEAEKRLSPTPSEQLKYTFNTAEIDIRKMQERYLRKHGVWCRYEGELLAEYRALGGKISPTTEKLIEKRLIAMEIVGGKVTVRDLRK